jgi:hypothetical protein
MNISKGGYGGLQASGFANIATGESEGLQATGFLNVAGKMNGGQVSGFLNVAKEVSFAQVGVINIAGSNKGLALGVLNFIADGIMSPAVYMDTSGWAYLQYQGGTQLFYTTFLAGMNTNWCQNWDYANTVFGAGIGSRLQIVPNISLDVELLWKHIVDFSAIRDLADVYTEEYSQFADRGTAEGAREETGRADRRRAVTLAQGNAESFVRQTLLAVRIGEYRTRKFTASTTGYSIADNTHSDPGKWPKAG